jgi:hypothetical protein
VPRLEAVPKGLFLCWYLFEPDPQSIQTKLHGYEKEIFAAGVIMIFLAFASIWSLCEKAATDVVPAAQGKNTSGESLGKGDETGQISPA